MKQEKLSYARLVSRTDFYKNKALDLEQQVVFGEETIKELESEMKQLRENGKKQVKEVQSRLDHLKADYQKVQDDYRKLQNDYQKLEAKDGGGEIKRLTEQLQEKEKIIGQLNETVAELNQNHEAEERIDKFEQLLSEVQTELNEKEVQLESYKTRVKNLERRLSQEQAVPSRKVFSETASQTDTDRKIIAYFDYSLVMEEQKESIIRGNFHIENISGQSLGTPYVCFRFYPLDAAALKGKIISIEQAERGGESQHPRWVFMDDDWGNTAKERGEIWVRPYEKLTLKPNENTTLADFQIPVKKHFDEKVVIEGFVYFQNDGYKEKAANQILITF